MILSYKDGIPYSQGSGFFIDKNTLATNFHCVAGAELAKRFSANGLGGWYDYSCNSSVDVVPRNIYFKAEFRLISYEIEE